MSLVTRGLGALRRVLAAAGLGKDERRAADDDALLRFITMLAAKARQKKALPPAIAIGEDLAPAASDDGFAIAVAIAAAAEIADAASDDAALAAIALARGRETLTNVADEGAARAGFDAAMIDEHFLLIAA